MERDFRKSRGKNIFRIKPLMLHFNFLAQVGRMLERAHKVISTAANQAQITALSYKNMLRMSSRISAV